MPERPAGVCAVVHTLPHRGHVARVPNCTDAERGSAYDGAWTRGVALASMVAGRTCRADEGLARLYQ